MAELSDKLGEPQLVLTLSNHIVGMTISNSSSRQLVLADYFNPEFRICTYTLSDKDPGYKVTGLMVEKVIGNNLRATFDGGEHRRLFIEPDARAQVGQVSNGGSMLLYLSNGSRHLGQLDLETGEVLPPLQGIKGERAEYFLQLRNGLIATVEGYKDCTMRLYEIVGNKLKLIDEKDLKRDFVYGLCQDSNDTLMFLTPEQGTYPEATNFEPGVERVTLGLNDLRKVRGDYRFDGKMPKDARGLAPIFNGFEDKIEGYLVSTYGFNRMRADMGEPSKIFYIPVIGKKD